MRAISEDFDRLHINNIVIQVVNLSRATYREANVLKKNLDELISIQKQQKIIVDISKCEFIDSTFLGVLVLALKSSAKINGDIRIVKPDEVVKALMEKAGTLNVFNLYDTLDEAIKSFEIRGDQNYYLAQGSPILA
ncbi:MAG: STAS domain-containing protein [Ignavibacteriaceae bacterium]|jgi:anti-anti-sigma factor|nr:STAS domain-containing protein [Ignavibacteriaceae bacterium]